MSADVREVVATASQVLARAGHDDLIWGHASARDSPEGAVWIKSASWGLGEVTADRVHLVGPAGEVRAGDGPRHSEYAIHTEIMAARPDVGGVVHTHAPYAVALGATGQPLRPVSHAATLFVPPALPVYTDTADLILTADLGRAVARTLGSARAVLLANHGLVAVGPDLPTATVVAVLLERACRQQLLTHQMGGWPTWSPPEESVSKRANIYSPRALLAVWEHLVRELDTPFRSTP